MKKGFTCGAFDLLHAGHVLMLQEAKTVCDYLIVGLQTDPSLDRKEKNQPVQSLLERQIQLSAIKYVDEIVIYEHEIELEMIFSALPIDIRIIGSDYMHKNFTGKDICEEKSIELYYNKRDHPFSSSELRRQINEDC